MKVKISKAKDIVKDKESLKTWIIIFLILSIVTIIAYYYGYPYLFNKIYEKAKDKIIFAILYQIQQTGKVKIGVGENTLILIPEASCLEVKT